MGNGNGAKRDGLTGHIEELKVLERFLEKGPVMDHFGAAEGKRIEYEERASACACPTSSVYLGGSAQLPRSKLEEMATSASEVRPLSRDRRAERTRDGLPRLRPITIAGQWFRRKRLF